MPVARPNHTQAELERIQRDFRPFRTLHWVCLYGGVGLVILGVVMKQNEALPILLGLALEFYAIATWKCPVCSGRFGRNWVRGYCPHCGTQLTE